MQQVNNKVQPTFPTVDGPSRPRSVSAPTTPTPSSSGKSSVESRVERSRSESESLKALTSPEVSGKILAKAEVLGSEKVVQNAQAPGLMDRIKNSAFGQFFVKLFQSPPPYGAAKGQLEIPPDAEPVREHDPGIKAKFGRATMVYGKDPTTGMNDKNFEVKKGDKCNVRKTDNPNILFVEVYKKNEKGDVEVTGSGYVFANAVTSHKQARSHVALDKNAPIFPKEPSPKDIKQGKMGDCFFLAGLSSIVARDPSLVQKMIKDNGDGTVTVKLHDVEIRKVQEHGQEVEKKVFTPKYITFDKSILHTDWSIREHADTSVPWVALMEKAYAIHKGSYTMLGEGGFASDVYETLLGKEAVKESLGKSTLVNNVGDAFKDKENPLFPDGEKAKTMKAFSEAMQNQIMEVTAKAATGTMALDDVEKLVAMKSPIAFKGSTIESVKAALVKDLNLSEEDAGKITNKLFATFKYGNVTMATSEELAEKLKAITPALSKEVMDVVVATAKPIELSKDMQEAVIANVKKGMSGPRGSGEYSEQQRAVFTKIQQGLESGKIMGAGTKHKIVEEDGGSGSVGTAGEEVVKGLVGGHDFSITGAVELKPGDAKYPGPKDGKPMLFVEVRNPWGNLPSGLAAVPSKLLNWMGIPEHGSRQYSYDDQTGKLNAKGSRDSVFLVEISDFTRHFEDIYSTK